MARCSHCARPSCDGRRRWSERTAATKRTSSRTKEALTGCRAPQRAGQTVHLRTQRERRRSLTWRRKQRRRRRRRRGPHGGAAGAARLLVARASGSRRRSRALLGHLYGTNVDSMNGDGHWRGGRRGHRTRAATQHCTRTATRHPRDQLNSSRASTNRHSLSRLCQHGHSTTQHTLSRSDSAMS